jgi:hypothetical protein
MIIKEHGQLHLLCAENVNKELNYLVAKDHEHIKQRQKDMEAK